jgi:hypothetical protein
MSADYVKKQGKEYKKRNFSISSGNDQKMLYKEGERVL